VTGAAELTDIMHAAPPAPTRARRLASMAAGGLGRLLLLAAFTVLAATYLPTLLFGYHRYVLVGHSMEPTIHRGSLVFDDVVPVAALHRGDVVTYVPPGATKPLSHRIIFVGMRQGVRMFRTKGDNNPVADPATFHFNEATQARVKFAIPYLGWIFIALTTASLRVWLIAVPAGLLALWGVLSIWREGGELLREQSATEAT
jgi:signal peptidase